MDENLSSHIFIFFSYHGQKLCWSYVTGDKGKSDECCLGDTWVGRFILQQTVRQGMRINYNKPSTEQYLFGYFPEWMPVGCVVMQVHMTLDWSRGIQISSDV